MIERFLKGALFLLRRLPHGPSSTYRMNFSDETISYLNQRAANYGGDHSSIIAITPSMIDTDCEMFAFWADRDLSHIYPQSTHPELADDWNNIIPENASINRARGNEIMNPIEIATAYSDNFTDAITIDATCTCSSVMDPL